ncbi:MAG: undecaprenyl-diphosphate phosphatase [Sphaerochaetaceae bacterium]|jgi:undecaprenyl-diphosphatase
MSFIEGLFLGVVQGLTEFLPVSSSGHLILARHYFNIDEVPLLFDVLLHVATLIVIVYHYRKLVGDMIVSFFRFITRKATSEDQVNLDLIVALIGSTLITVIFVLLFRKFNIESNSILSVSLLMFVTAALLATTNLAATRIKKVKKIGYKQILFTGVGQGFGVLAGISRSGATITSALYSGMERKDAADFAFLLSIPAILGALALTLVEEGGTMSVAVVPTVAGFISAFIVGLITLRVLLWMIKSARLWYFSIYLVLVGSFGLFTYFS